MKRIWKYPLDVTDRQTLRMPRGARVLSAQVQADRLQLWALVDDTAPTAPRYFAIYGTGNRLPGEPGAFVGTVQHGALVWHVFEVGAP